MRELRRWKRLWWKSLTHSHKRTSMGPSRSCWNGTTSPLQLEEITSKGTRVSCVYYELKCPYEKNLETYCMHLVYIYLYIYISEDKSLHINILGYIFIYIYVRIYSYTSWTLTKCWEKSYMGTAHRCCVLFWTNVESSIPPNGNCMATSLPSHKPSILVGEARMNSKVLLVNTERLSYINSVQIMDTF